MGTKDTIVALNETFELLDFLMGVDVYQFSYSGFESSSFYILPFLSE